MEKGTKYLLYFFILGCLAFPFIQKKKNLLFIAPLKASTETIEEPGFSLVTLKSGAFQEQYANYLDHNFGARAFLIRILNQLKFSLFHHSDAPGVVVGKYNYLYLSSYTNNYLGLNFIGQNKIEENARKLKQIQDSLKKQNVDLVIVFAPGKASFYSEFLPDNLKSKKREVNNLNAYSAAFKNHEVNFIDLNSWFIALKKKARYALYPELGVHYTPHGTFLTTDTLVRYIEKLRNIDLPDVTKYTVYLSDSLREQEHDVEELMNLQYPLFHQPAPYFKLTAEKQANQIKPDLLGIGDSYWWQLTGLNLVSPFFKKDVYWYYNKSIYVDNTKQETAVNNLHYGDELVSRDVIVIMASEATYDLFPFEFIDKAYPVFCMTPVEKVNWLNEKVKSDAAWQESIKQKAKTNGISESEQQQKDIEYVINNDFTAYKAPKSYIDSVIHSYRDVILKNPEWLAGVKKKASEKYIPFEWQLDLDAAYGYGMDYETEEAVQKLNQIKKEIRKSGEKLKLIEQNAMKDNLSFNEAMAWEIKRIYDEHRYNQ